MRHNTSQKHVKLNTTVERALNVIENTGSQKSDPPHTRVLPPVLFLSLLFFRCALSSFLSLSLSLVIHHYSCPTFIRSRFYTPARAYISREHNDMTTDVSSSDLITNQEP